MSTTLIDQLMEPFAECLTEDAARRIVALRADVAVQTRVDELADMANRGVLSADDRAEYDRLLAAYHLVSLIQARARRMLDK